MFIILPNKCFTQNLIIQIKEWEALWIYQSIDALTGAAGLLLHVLMNRRKPRPAHSGALLVIRDSVENRRVIVM